MTEAQILSLGIQTNPRLIQASDNGLYYAISAGQTGATAKGLALAENTASVDHTHVEIEEAVSDASTAKNKLLKVDNNSGIKLKTLRLNEIILDGAIISELNSGIPDFIYGSTARAGSFSATGAAGFSFWDMTNYPTITVGSIVRPKLTGEWTWTLPDKAGTVALTSDITGTNSGTNTGDITVTDSSEIDFTLTGQALTASLIAGSIDESKLDASVNASLDLADSALQDVADFSTATIETPAAEHAITKPANGTYAGQKVVYHIKPSVGINLTNANGLLVASDSGMVFPKALTQDKLYIVQIIWGSNGWMLSTLVGGY